MLAFLRSRVALPRWAATAQRVRATGGLAGILRLAMQFFAHPWLAFLRTTVATSKRPSKTEKKFARYLRCKEGHRRKAARIREQRAEAASTAREKREAYLATLSADERAKVEAERLQSFLAIRKSAEEAKAAETARLLDALDSGLRVAIDCAYNTLMSQKEQKSLARQLCFAYASNRKLAEPFSLHICGLGDSLPHSLPDGFDRWHVRTAAEEACAHFPREQVVYLTPDSPHTLDAIDERCAYVIGGLVDGTIKKSQSLQRAEQWGVRTARLPIQEHALDCKPVLTINGVVELLAAFRETANWGEAIRSVSIAGRKLHPSQAAAHAARTQAALDRAASRSSDSDAAQMSEAERPCAAPG